MLNIGSVLVIFSTIYILSYCCVKSMCIGKYLNFSHVEKRNISNIFINGFELRPGEAIWENTGQTVVIKFKYEKLNPFVTAGPLANEIYKLNFMYYNWLNVIEVDQTATEGGMLFPVELHAVLVNQRFANYEDALTKDLGILVVTFKHQIVDDKTWNYLDLFYDPIEQIQNPNTTFLAKDPQTPNLMNVFNIAAPYKVYVGKAIFEIDELCGGDVIWLEHSIDIEIKKKQVKSFHKLTTFGGAPLMQQTSHFTPPNSTIYCSLNHLTDVNDPIKSFEGFQFAFDSGLFIFTNKKIFVICIIFDVIMNMRISSL